MSILICPVCGQDLFREQNRLLCDAGHSYDISRRGYVNLLLGSKSGSKTGDSKQSAAARRALLDKGYYGLLKDYITKKMRGTVLDICCGEGYYDDYSGELYGFDISKEMARLAAGRHKDNHYFVANISSIPVRSESVDTAVNIFAPFNDKEFYRVMKKGASLYCVVGGADHLRQMKEIIYDTPYKNDEIPPASKHLRIAASEKISHTVKIPEEDLKTLFAMTPYFYRTSQKDKAKLNGIGETELTVEFVIYEYKKDG